MRKILVCILLTGILFTRPAFAGSKSVKTPSVTDFDIEQLMAIEVETVYGASKFEQAITQAPSSVTVITAQEIAHYGWRNLADVLENIRGFYINNDRSYQFIGSRGFSLPGDYNTRYLLLVNGHRANDLIYGVAAIGGDAVIDIDLVEKIEIIRGPGSSLYGSNALFGVINVVTRNPETINGMEISGEVASFDGYKGRTTYGKAYESGFAALFSGSYGGSHGRNFYFREYDSPATNNGWADNCDSEKFGNFFGSLSYKGLTLEGAYVSREKSVPTAIYGTVFNDNHTRNTDIRGYVDLKYTKKIGDKNTITTRAYYDYTSFEGNYVYDYPPPVINKDFGIGELWGASVEITSLLGKRHTISAGMSYENNFRQSLTNYDQAPYALYLRDESTSYVFAAYAQDQIVLKENLILNLGLRYDHYKSFGDAVSPRAALIYNPFQKTTLKFLYGEAFRSPNVYELYVNDGGLSSKSNPNLDSETISTYELVLEQYFSNYRFSLSGFYYRTDNLISQIADPTDGLLVFQNIGRVETKGGELEIQRKWKNGIDAVLSYTYQESVNKGIGSELFGDELINSPKHLVKFRAYVPILGEKLGAGIAVRYTGPRKTGAGNHTGGAVVADVTFLSRELIKGLTLSGSVYNIFDKEYASPASDEYNLSLIPQDGRTFRIKCTYRF